VIVDLMPRGMHLLRRFGAIFYDSLLLFAVLYFATIPVVLVNGGRTIPAEDPLYMGYLVFVSFLYFGWFWTHGGQTLGMKAWRICVRSRDGGRVGWKQCFVRFATALASWVPLGLGFLWSVVRSDGNTWHDLASGTKLVVLPRSL